MATRKKKNTAPTETDCDAALRVLYADYFSDVRGVAKDLARQMKDGEISDGDEFRERLSEAVDGSQRVIYTYQAKVGLICTNHPDTYFEEMGELPLNADGSLKWEAMMFMAMERDVEERLSSSVDVNDPDTWSDIDLKEFD